MFCRAPFIALSMTPNGNYVCCMNVKIPIEQHRIDIYNNNIPEVCKECLIKKDFNDKKYDSLYQENMNNFNLKTGKIKNFKIGNLHIVNNWNCNCGCKICGTRDFEGISIKEEEFNKINFNHLKYISLQGGEIFLYPNSLIKIIEKINNSSYLNIFTNGTIYNENILKKIKNRKNTIITVSLDGTNENQSYMRPNSSYKEIIKNINKMQQFFNNKIKIRINYTVSIFNIYNIIDDLLQFKNDINYDFDLHINFVIQPFYYNISTLPIYIKNDILNNISLDNIIKNNLNKNFKNLSKIYKIYGINIFNELISLLKTNPIEINKFKVYNEVMYNDLEYNLDIKILYPKIIEYILSCKKAT